MATTVDQAFRDLRSRLEITAPQASVISTRQNRVRDTIATAMTVVDDFLTGSYARSTMIAPLKEADIDIFMVLDPKYYHHYNGQNGGPAGLLDYTKRTLLKTYTRTPDISRNGQAVTIRFDDFVIDVVVGFNRQGGGYIMANALKNSWLSTDPKKHVELVTASNKVHNGDLVRVIKMLKGWNKSRLNSHFRSFHLEVLALEIFRGVTISNFPSGCRFFFDKARGLIRGKNLDPAGYGDDVGSYIVGQTAVEDAVRKLARAYDYAVKAETFASRGQHRDAILAWEGVFNDYFPAYG
jgi:hypothetical protein